MISKEKAEYRESSIGHKCKDCDMFVKPNNCTLVKGTIHPNGVCKYWEEKK